MEIRKAASSVFEEWRTQYLTGQELIKNADDTGDRIFEILQTERTKGIYGSSWRNVVSSFFPKWNPERALANLLAVTHRKFNGICSGSGNHEWGTFWQRQYKKVGGHRHVQAFLVPPRLVVSAILLLYLCESGTNSEVAFTMKATAIRPSRSRGYLSVVGRKARARNKAIFTELPTRSHEEGCTSAAQAIMVYRDSVERARTGTQETALFFHIGRGGLKPMSEWRLRTDLDMIRLRSKHLSSLKVLPSMIRPTVLLALQLKHPLNPDIVQLMAQHKRDTTTMGYVAKLPYRMILEERIRTFSQRFEAVIAEESAWRMIGESDEERKGRMEDARRTGLGVWCRDPKAGTQPDFPKGTTCHAVDRCLFCSKIMVVADRESVADMVIWRKALDAVEDAWLNDRTERWETMWVPWQAFFKVVLDEKMARGQLALIKKQGEECAIERMAAPGFRVPEPW